HPTEDCVSLVVFIRPAQDIRVEDQYRNPRPGAIETRIHATTEPTQREQAFGPVPVASLARQSLHGAVHPHQGVPLLVRGAAFQAEQAVSRSETAVADLEIELPQQLRERKA